jgi:membrane protein required for beta-lactamase induction
LRLFWPLALVFDVAVLVYCLGPRNLSNQVALFLDAHQRGDQDAASQIAAQIHTGGAVTGAGTLAHQVTEAILVQANRRVLGVLVWFALLGPLGAMLYRLTEQLAHSADGPDGKDVNEDMRFSGAAVRLYGMLDWPPARLVTLGYALAGSFQGTMEAVRARESDWWGLKPANNESVLVAGGLGALALPALGRVADVLAERADIESALALVKRTLVLGLIMVALVTIGYWAG